MVTVTLNTADSFVNYWSRNLPGNKIDLDLYGLRLSTKHIESFRGHEPRVRNLSLQGAFKFEREANARLFWTLICNCSSLLELSVRTRFIYFMDHLHWCCYRPPICQSLKSLIIGYCRLSDKAMALLAAAIEKGSVLSEFGISSWRVGDADITPIIFGDNRLEKFSLRYYDLGAAEVGAFFLSAKRHNNWKHLILNTYTLGYGFNLNIFTSSLRVASKSPAKIDFGRVARPASISKVIDLKEIIFGDRVAFV